MSPVVRGGSPGIRQSDSTVGITGPGYFENPPGRKLINSEVHGKRGKER